SPPLLPLGAIELARSAAPHHRDLAPALTVEPLALLLPRLPLGGPIEPALLARRKEVGDLREDLTLGEEADVIGVAIHLRLGGGDDPARMLALERHQLGALRVEEILGGLAVGRPPRLADAALGEPGLDPPEERQGVGFGGADPTCTTAHLAAALERTSHALAD